MKADKSDVYSLDGEGSVTGADPHNLYAPFYMAYIGAAGWISGTSGVAHTPGNNFPTVRRASDYDYWDTLLEEPYSNPAQHV